MKRLTFSLPMTRALRAGLKTETRRVSPPAFSVGEIVAVAEPCTVSLCQAPGCVPYLHCEYTAGGAVTLDGDVSEIDRCSTMKTVINRTPRSGRFMPGWAERTRLRILAIEEQRLGDITEADAVAEGFADRAAFLAYFATLHKGAPDLTLPVWVIRFEVTR
jgi:hypothetical protein